jgi:hypothetical protein
MVDHRDALPGGSMAKRTFEPWLLSSGRETETKKALSKEQKVA